MNDDWTEYRKTICRDHLMPLDVLLEMGATDTEFLVDNRIPRTGLTYLVGVSGSRKSWLAYDLARAVATGVRWLDLEARQGRVLILNYDNPTIELARRLRRLQIMAGAPIFIHTEQCSSDLLRLPAKETDLQAIIHEIKPDLLIIDSFRKLHTLDENSSQEMAQITSILRGWAGLGIAVVVLHHSPRPVTDPNARDPGLGRTRGSTEIDASADAIIAVGEDDDGPFASWAPKTRAWTLGEGDLEIRFEVIDSGNATTIEVR